uniref:Uncharacterized protein n=1 Tax=Romanomermis culicivorax TaxID=13658 RepID=A0A915HRP8_ROMCU
MENGYGEVPHLLEHAVAAQRLWKYHPIRYNMAVHYDKRPCYNDDICRYVGESLTSYVRIHGGSARAQTNRDHTFYEFTGRESVLKDMLNKFGRRFFQMEITEEMVKFHYKIIADEYVKTRRNAEWDNMWLYDGVKFSFEPLNQRLSFKRGINMAE